MRLWYNAPHMSASCSPVRRFTGTLLLSALLLLAGCAPSGAVQNVLTLRLREALGTWPPPLVQPAPGDESAIEGRVLVADLPAAGVSVLVAGPTGAPFVAVTDSAGRYRIGGLPPGSYVPVAVGPGLEEGAAVDRLGIPWLAQTTAGATLHAPDIRLQPHVAPPLPNPADAGELAALEPAQVGATSVVTSSFPAGAAAQRSAWRFVRDGVEVNTLRLFLPPAGGSDLADSGAGAAEVEGAAPLPLFLLVYPSFVDGWEAVSVAFAAQGYAVLALSPVETRGADIEAHAQDARLALRLAQAGAFQPTPPEGTPPEGAPQIDVDSFVVLGGSYSSAIVHRLLRDLAADGVEKGAAQPAGWVTVGGIANAFRGTADYWAGRLEIPEWHADAVPALGLPNLQPLPFLRYSPVYTAAQMPPTLIIHTDADRVLLIDQAEELAAALEAAGVPVEFYAYSDTSHYLQVGEETSEAGKAMFNRILEFLNQRLRGEEP